MNDNILIIIGAGRSGTNILRNTLTAQENWQTWPCDEINLIWRHGNITYPNDALGKEHARPAVKNYIRTQFARLERKTKANVIVEKTCANSLRVSFVDACFPRARYLHIVRDGRDVALSAARRWTAPPEFGYLLKKLNYVPLTDIPYYSTRFIGNRIHQLRSRERRQRAWGPRFKDMQSWVEEHTLLEVCAKQWAQCVSASDYAFNKMDNARHLTIYYEDFVKRPLATIDIISNWYGEDLSEKIPACALEKIKATKVEGWRKQIDSFSELANSVMNPVLRAHGYKVE